MQPSFRVTLNSKEFRGVASVADVDRLIRELTGLPAFTVDVYTAPGEPTLDIIVESDRALVNFLDVRSGVKLASRSETCTERDIVSLRNDAYPELELDQIDVERR